MSCLNTNARYKYTGSAPWYQLKCKLGGGNITRWRSESFRISNLLPQIKKVWIRGNRCKPQQILSSWWKRRNLSELLRNLPAVYSLWIGGRSSSCFEYRGLHAMTVDWQMNQRYLRYLSFHSTLSCVRVRHAAGPNIFFKCTNNNKL